MLGPGPGGWSLACTLTPCCCGGAGRQPGWCGERPRNSDGRLQWGSQQCPIPLACWRANQGRGGRAGGFWLCACRDNLTCRLLDFVHLVLCMCSGLLLPLERCWCGLFSKLLHGWRRVQDTLHVCGGAGGGGGAAPGRQAGPGYCFKSCGMNVKTSVWCYALQQKWCAR